MTSAHSCAGPAAGLGMALGEALCGSSHQHADVCQIRHGGGRGVLFTPSQICLFIHLSFVSHTDSVLGAGNIDMDKSHLLPSWAQSCGQDR